MRFCVGPCCPLADDTIIANAVDFGTQRAHGGDFDGRGVFGYENDGATVCQSCTIRHRRPVIPRRSRNHAVAALLGRQREHGVERPTEFE